MQENPDLWKWLTGQEQPPEPIETNHVRYNLKDELLVSMFYFLFSSVHSCLNSLLLQVFNAVRDKVMNNLNTHTSPETRAMPGQPWVRGWDDFKKGRDSPVMGNQQFCFQHYKLIFPL